MQLWAAIAVVASARAAQPNILWIMADDLGWGEPGTARGVASPHGRIATPHIDRLFGEEGLVFTHAYAGYTVCAPSRTAFFTGRHSGQFRKHGLDGQNLPPGGGAPATLAEMLRGAGYRTAAFGKTAPLVAPAAQGFETYLGQLDQGVCHNMYPATLDADNGTDNVALPLNAASNKSRALCMAAPERYNYTIDVWQSAAVEWLERAAAARARDDRPFFAYVSFTIPHAGGWGDAPDTPEQGNPVPTDLQYANESAWPDVEKDHAAVVAYLDRYVGALAATLRRAGVENDTYVFFASDNGAHSEGGHDVSFFNSTGGLRGFKRSLYEGGVRSPTCARRPGVVPAGATSAQPWAFWDVLPTLAELAGVDVLPADDLDGASIAPLLRGERSDDEPPRYLYFTWTGAGAPYGYAARRGRYKGVVPNCTDAPAADDAWELYDLIDDPFETRDLAPAGGDEPQTALADLRAWVLAGNFSCECFQC